MKRILMTLVAAVLVFFGCNRALRLEMAEMRVEISSIKEQIKGMNTSIGDLRTILSAIQDNVFVKTVTPVKKDGKVIGYTLSFTDNTVVTIYDSGEGDTELGVRQDSDGNWYWTLGGKWLLDDAGKKVNASGIEGKTPMLKIEEGDWYVSVDDGKTWTRLGRATGDSLFKGIDCSSTDSITLILADGTELRVPTWSAFAALQETVRQLNANISSYQAIIEALQNSDYVVSTSPYLENGVQVGYQINFSKSGPLVIYYGKDGKDGTDGHDGVDGHDGQDGHTPQIGIRQDEDGEYYWTVDGEWLTDDTGAKYKAVGKDGSDGADGHDGIDGLDGIDGIDGHDGADGVTPELKIEGDFWYVSLDKGETWTQLGKATGEDGSDGDSFFSGVDTSDENVVLFVLSDGTEIRVPTQKAFEALGELVGRMNANLGSLRDIVTALQDNDYVKSVAPYYEGMVQVGYIITFVKSGSVVIYNGKDGTDGQDGEDGHSPSVGVRQDTDGEWYWTLDGEWLLDADGAKVRANGKDGADGHDGQDGSDGVTPQMKIVGDYWYVSLDNGETWTQLGRATGEAGAGGAAGDSFFSGVDTSNTDVVLFVLSDGTEIRVPTWSAFEALQEAVRQLNTNISSYQTIIEALQNSDYVVSTSPYFEGGVQVGYQINFSKSGPLVIYFGKDGQDGIDGHDGQDGHTPQIGIRQDTDGEYYWTLDGEWLLDDTGAKCKAVGKDGSDGADGHDGSDGVTPQMKIVGDYWYVSLDNGDTWTQLGKATGEAGAGGAAGDSFFSGVDTSSSDYVLFVLSDGTEIKIPTWGAFEALRTLVNQLNTNLTALQDIVTALQDKDYVQSVAPYYEGGVQVGYVITFVKSGSVVIYHGKDGADGHDGTDGHTPAISVRQDTDGQWYWTLDGEWLLDETGAKVRANGKDGADGQNGNDGNDGQNGVTPQLKIEDGYWYVSVDEGATWTQLGKATGEDGQNGTDGDSFFSGVDTSNAEYVVLTLSDGTEIKVPTWSAFEALRTLVNQLNTNLTALQAIVTALQDNDYVQSVTPYIVDGKQVGYILAFSKSGSVIIYHGQDGVDGQNGNTPAIGIRQDLDGEWYWTLDGEWMLDETGAKVRANGKDGADGENGSDGNDGQNGADGITPQLKIEDGYWYVSVDEGATWAQLGKATGEDGQNGADGDSFFSSVVRNGDHIVFTLSDGTDLTVPCYEPIEITLSTGSESPLIAAGEKITISYTLSGGVSDDTQVTASSDGNYIVSVQKSSNTGGVLNVTCPNVYSDGYINFMVFSGGHSYVRVINFVERELSFSDGLEYHVGYEATTLNIPYSANFEYGVSIRDDAASWISHVETRALHSGTVVLSVSGNFGSYTSRTGHIDIIPSDHPGYVHNTITVVQSSELVPVSSVSLDETELLLYARRSATLTATVLPSTASEQGVTWMSSDSSIATVDENGNVTAVAAGIATITVTTTDGGKTASCEVTVRPIPEGAVDMGLSVFWADHNLGASAPGDYGDYYAWGETEVSGYSWNTYKWSMGEYNSLTKYCNYTSYGYNGFTDNKTVLDLEDDAANVNIGGNWRMPTVAEWTELRENCTWTWTIQNGVSGSLVTASDGNSIFLPAAGYSGSTYLSDEGSSGYYWSSSLYMTDPSCAHHLRFDADGVYGSNGYRCAGRSVRPVYDVQLQASEIVPVSSVSLDQTALTRCVGSNVTLVATVRPATATDKGLTWTSSNTGVAAVDQDGHVTAVGPGSATISVVSADGGKTATCAVSIEQIPLVDLGLSVKWASYNLGASSYGESGGYYAWGELEPKDFYYWTTYDWCVGTSDTFTKYCNDSSLGYNGFVDNKTTLDPEDDVAHVVLGGKWRMPTRAEWEELRDNCTLTWVTMEGVEGYKAKSNITGYKNKWIFIPAAGRIRDDAVVLVATNGYYWSGTLSSGSGPNYAYGLEFATPGEFGPHGYARCYGHTIRPVSERATAVSVHVASVTLSKSSLTLHVGSSATLTATVLPSNASDKSVTWKSSNGSVATVNQNGKVTAVAAGTATITVTTTDGGKTASCTVNVN